MTYAAPTDKVCPSCAGLDHPADAICRYCGFDFRIGPGFAYPQPYPPVAFAPSPSRAGAVLTIIAGSTFVIGSFLPWATVTVIFGSLSVSGMDGGDGIFTLLAGLVTLVIGIVAIANSTSPSVGFGIVPLISGAICGLLTLYEIVDVNNRIADLQRDGEGFATASVGAGLWILLAGSAVSIVGGILAIRERHATRRPVPR